MRREGSPPPVTTTHPSSPSRLVRAHRGIVIHPLAVEEWIRACVEPVGTIETVHERPWATVLRVPLATGVVWFKACAPVQAFEPRLTAELYARWPDRVAEVLAYDEERAWLLLADAGKPVGAFGDPPEAWLAALPLYGELQRGEAAYAQEHLARGVPDLRLATLPARYDELLQLDLPLEREEARRLLDFAPRLVELCDELAAYDVPDDRRRRARTANPRRRATTSRASARAASSCWRCRDTCSAPRPCRPGSSRNRCPCPARPYSWAGSSGRPCPSGRCSFP